MARFSFLSFALTALVAQGVNAAIPTADHGFVARSLTWTGEVVPRAGDVSISGTAQEIYEEIMRRNPDYDFDNMPRLSARDASKPGCDATPPVSVEAIGYQLDFLYKLGKGTACIIKGKGCARTTCSHGGATYLCAETDKGASFPCNTLISVHEMIVDQCKCKKDNKEIVQGKWYSGDRSYSLWLGKPNSDCDSKRKQSPTDGQSFKKEDFCTPSSNSSMGLERVPGEYEPKAQGKWWHKPTTTVAATRGGGGGAAPAAATTTKTYSTDTQEYTKVPKFDDQ